VSYTHYSAFQVSWYPPCGEWPNGAWVLHGVPHTFDSWIGTFATLAEVMAVIEDRTAGERGL
jgi:hypothetical protein